MGWLVNHQKSELEPTQDLQFLGIRFLTSENRILVPDNRWQNIQSCIPDALNTPLDLRTWQQILGLLTSAQALTRRGRLQLRPLQRFLIAHLDNVQKFAIPQHLKQFLLWWTVRSNVCGGTYLREPNYNSHLYVDASLQGWGAHLNDEVTAGRWSQTENGLHINQLELKAVIEAVLHWAPQLKDQVLMIHTDYSTVAFYINLQGSTRSAPLLQLTFQLFNITDEINLKMRACHIPGAKNVLADALSKPVRPSPTEWKLHPGAFQWITAQLGCPLIDLFATSFNNQVTTFVSPVPDLLAWAVDDLAISWEGMKAYAFPPPILLPQVLRKISRTRVLQLTLVAPYWPARLWFPDLIDHHGEPVLRLPDWPNLLVHPHTKQRHGNPKASQLHIWSISHTA
ncbi:uncharacterized protein LOC124278679 [Haliotis rubra]|uniref:uncharacterized protein LOC124278679 n=1 Tax=Haliotis rubra TaxID=36100 RepID=UPI001EE59CF3|nr:uncharacterized protein LOC124278679 [Haliotis rubra]